MSATHFRWKSSVAVLAVIATFCGALQAQERSYIEEYRLYQAALERDDTAAARTHGKAAWELAQNQLGEHATTATLAYNYGFITLFLDPAEALLALESAGQSMNEGVAQLPAQDLAVYIAYARFVTSARPQREVDALRNALATHSNSGAPPVFEIFRIWTAVAMHEFQSREFQKAEQSATTALAMITTLFPQQYQLHASAMLLRGAAKLVRFSRSAPLSSFGSNIRRQPDMDLLGSAYTDFVHVINSYPAVPAGNEIDPALAQAIAWTNATRALTATALPDEAERLIASWPVYEHPMQIEMECRYEWLNQESPIFPREYVMLGSSGAVVVMYDIDDNGRVENARIVAEVPGRAFGSNVLEAMSEWQRKPDQQAEPQCRRNYIQSFAFVLEN